PPPPYLLLGGVLAPCSAATRDHPVTFRRTTAACARACARPPARPGGGGRLAGPRVVPGCQRRDDAMRSECAARRGRDRRAAGRRASRVAHVARQRCVGTLWAAERWHATSAMRAALGSPLRAGGSPCVATSTHQV